MFDLHRSWFRWRRAGDSGRALGGDAVPRPRPDAALLWANPLLSSYSVCRHPFSSFHRECRLVPSAPCWLWRSRVLTFAEEGSLFASLSSPNAEQGGEWAWVASGLGGNAAAGLRQAKWLGVLGVGARITKASLLIFAVARAIPSALPLSSVPDALQRKSCALALSPGFVSLSTPQHAPHVATRGIDCPGYAPVYVPAAAPAHVGTTMEQQQH
jgi:hypothetical protein